MKKFVVETYYTCTFKTIHKLDDLNDQELAKIDSRNDGDVEVIEVKLNNRKTKKVGESSKSDIKKSKNLDQIAKPLLDQVSNSSKTINNNAEY